MHFRPICQALKAKVVQPTEPGANKVNTIIWKKDDAVCMRILKRKHIRGGSGIRTSVCCCKEAGGASDLCAVHTLWPWLEKLDKGAEPWGHIDEERACGTLQEALRIQGVADADRYQLQDLRRGTAEVRTNRSQIRPVTAVCRPPFCRKCARKGSSGQTFSGQANGNLRRG